LAFATCLVLRFRIRASYGNRTACKFSAVRKDASHQSRSGAVGRRGGRVAVRAGCPWHRRWRERGVEALGVGERGRGVRRGRLVLLALERGRAATRARAAPARRPLPVPVSVPLPLSTAARSLFAVLPDVRMRSVWMRRRGILTRQFIAILNFILIPLHSIFISIPRHRQPLGGQNGPSKSQIAYTRVGKILPGKFQNTDFIRTLNILN